MSFLNKKIILLNFNLIKIIIRINGIMVQCFSVLLHFLSAVFIHPSQSEVGVLESGDATIKKTSF